MKHLPISLIFLVFVTGFSQEKSILSQKIEDLASLYEQNNYHGVVLVARDSIVIGSAAFGRADQESGRKNLMNTLFRTESAGKLFTATAILQLVERGKIDLKNTIADYLADTKIKNADKITIHQLLTHQSGLTSPWERPGFEFREYERKEWWHIIETNALAFDEPGSSVYYSSSAYEVLAYIVEAVSGTSFKAYCETEIFDRAGMVNTFYKMDSLQFLKKGAKPYRWLGHNTYYQYSLRTFHAGGAGGWISSAGDFYRFAEALLNEKLLSKNSLELMMTKHVSLGSGKYGYGMEIHENSILPGKTLYGHNGGGMGFSCDLFFEPESHLIGVTMLNMYADSRKVTGNFMGLAMNNDPVHPEIDRRSLLFDMIEKNGLEHFSLHYANYLAEIGIDPTDAYFLISFGDAYDLLQLPDKRQAYFETLKMIIPYNPVVFLLLGDIAVENNEDMRAVEYYSTAKSLAEKYEPQWLGEINRKLALVN